MNRELEMMKFADAIGKAATPWPSDDETAAVIREARANLAREQARSILDESELFAMLGVQTRDEFSADVLPALVALGWILGNQQSAPNGPQLRGGGLLPLAVDRWSLDRWLAHFDVLARALGYVKAAPRAASAARVAAAVGLALALAFTR